MITKPYLGGAINGCSDADAADWRNWLIHMHFPNAINPMVRDYRGQEQENYREIVDLDKRDIRRSEALIVRYMKPSVGTSMEILYAWDLGLPIVVICDPDTPVSPWLRYHSSAIVYNFSDAVAFIEKIE